MSTVSISAEDRSKDLLEVQARRSRAVADYMNWKEWAAQHTTPEQAAAAAALTDEEVVRLVHESR
jgi:hypothetical protein